MHLPSIKDKHDLATAEYLVELGYPAVAEALPDMLSWIQDANWPVAGVVAPFLASIGEPLSDELWKVLRSDDLLWKYWCIQLVIGRMPRDAARAFVPELQRLANSPLPEEKREELHEVAADALEILVRSPP